MFIVSYTDLVQCFIVICVFSFFNMIHRVIIPGKYSSVLQMEENEGRTLQSTAIRILYITIGSIVFFQFLRFTKQQIVCGVFIAFFLNVWPAIKQYHLINLFQTKERWMLLLRYVLLIVIAVLVSIFSIEVVLPILKEEKKLYLLENQGINFFLWIISLIISMTIEQIIVKYSKVVVDVNIDTFKEELYILLHQVQISDFFDEKNEYFIDMISSKYDLSVKWLQTFLRIERYHRGNFVNRNIETIACCIFTDYAIKKDISVGVSQIKISTAQKLLKKSPEDFIKEIWRDSYNIELAAKYIRYLVDEYHRIEIYGEDWEKNRYNDIFEYVACQYNGVVDPDIKTQSVLIYSAILRSVIGESINYDGSEGIKNYVIHITGKVDYDVYQEIRYKLGGMGKITKEIYVNQMMEFFLYSYDCCSIYKIKELVKSYNLTMSAGPY